VIEYKTPYNRPTRQSSERITASADFGVKHAVKVWR
jgi:hypothetical protein